MASLRERREERPYRSTTAATSSKQRGRSAHREYMARFVPSDRRASRGADGVGEGGSDGNGDGGVRGEDDGALSGGIGGLGAVGCGEIGLSGGGCGAASVGADGGGTGDDAAVWRVMMGGNETFVTEK